MRFHGIHYSTWNFGVGIFKQPVQHLAHPWVGCGDPLNLRVSRTTNPWRIYSNCLGSSNIPSSHISIDFRYSCYIPARTHIDTAHPWSLQVPHFWWIMIFGKSHLFYWGLPCRNGELIHGGLPDIGRMPVTELLIFSASEYEFPKLQTWAV